MKKWIRPLFFLLFLFPGHVHADDFLGAPMVEGGKIVNKTKSRLEMTTPMTHDQVLQFYRDTLKKQKDIKFRDWEDATYIEDDGALKWHSVTISKRPQNSETQIFIVKDNWTWIIGTLILRFIAVFVVLLVLFLGMNVSGKIISNMVKKAEARKAEAKA